MRAPLLLVLTLLLAGCLVRHPLGIPDEEWKRLPPEQQMAARERQAELDRQAAERRARAEEERRRELEARRANARYGDVVQCVVEEGVAKIGSSLREVEPVAFSVLRGEGETLAIRSKHGGRRGSLWATFLEDGMSVKLCPLGSWYSHCARLIGTAGDFRRGIERRLIVDSMLDLRVRCGFAPVGFRSFW